MNEKRLIKKLSDGNVKALEMLIDTYTAYVGSVVYSVIGKTMSHEDIEETAADVFVEVWKHPERLHEGKIKPFLGSVARNLALNKLRQRTATVSAEENEFLLFDDSFETEIDRHEKSEMISDALQTLSDSERDIFIRYYYFGQTSKMISEFLDIPVSTVTSRLSRGRKKMKNYLVTNGIVTVDQSERTDDL